MKLAIVFCAVLGISLGAVVPHGNHHSLAHHHGTRNLGDLLNELMEFIPKEKILEIALNYLENDPEVQEAVAYLKSDDFKKLVSTVEGMPQFKEMAQFLADSGLDIYTYINFVNDLLGLPHYEPSRHVHFRGVMPRGIMDMVHDILAVIPLDEIKAFYHEKVENDPEFKELMARLGSPEFIELVETVRNMPEYQDMLQRLKAHGIDVEAIVKKINDFFGWGKFSLHYHRNLNDLLMEFLQMIPVDKIKEIFYKYLANDPEVQEAVAYLKSDEFEKMVVTVQNMPQYLETLEYIYNAGIDVYTYINHIHELLGLPPVHRPGTIRRFNRSLMDMVHEVLSILPIEEMKAFYHEKVENNPEFLELLEKLRAPEFIEMVDAVRNMPEYKDLLNRLMAHGIDVEAIQKKINDFFGWGKFSLHSQRNLNDLLMEFLQMIPVDKIKEIFYKYLASDPEVQEAVAYLKSDEFQKIVETVQSMPQYVDFLEYVYNAGIDIYTYINYFHDLLGLPPVHRPGTIRHSNRTLMDMIHEILTIIPIEEMKAFYHEKVENNPEFLEFLDKVMTPEFLEIVNAVRNMPEFQDLLDRLKNHGIDVEAIQKKIDDFFHWGRFSFHSQRNLNDLLMEFLQMIPVDKIKEIFYKYLASDPEVQEAVAYLKSDEFEKMVVTVQSMPQYLETLEYIYNAGIDVYTYINHIHELLGLPPVHRPGTIRRFNRSLMDMVHEVLSILPIEEMKAFYHEKVENNPEFLELLEKLRAPEFIEMVDAVRNMPEYKDLLNRLMAHGIDVEAIQKKINDFFGWGKFSLHSQRNLNDLLMEFLQMIPVDKIKEIFYKYLASDPEVQEAVAYLKSDEFQKIVETVQSMPQYVDFLEYVYNAGIDVYTYINYFHDLLGLPPVHRPGTIRHSNRTLMDMIHEILTIIPIEEMKAFYHEKVENNPEFLEFLDKLMTPEFLEIVNAVRNMPEYQDLLDRLKNHGIDVEAIQKKINDFFHWGRFSFHSQRNLNDLLMEFLQMIPVDKIKEIFYKYLASDPEVQEAVAYLKSDEFEKMVVTVQSMPQYLETLEYIYNAGIDVYTYINHIHELLGLPPVHRPGTIRRFNRSLMDMVHEVLSILPIEEMKAFYHEKVENNPEFLELLEKLRAPEFIEMVDAVRNMPEYKDLLNRLMAHGIDVEAIQKKINDFFGW